jgi:two-component system, cell cycle response regulator DivK
MANERILVVEDNPSNVKLARLLLEKAGYEVRVAGDSAETLETLRSFAPRLILMDIQLPGMDGLTLTRQLRASGILGDTIIVAVTAYAMQGDQERAKAAGCDGYITKPINTRTFVDQVRGYLKEVPAEPAPQPEADPNDLLSELRNTFIAEGTESSHKYSDKDHGGSDADARRRIVHHWAGMAGTLGFPEITAVARELENVLATQPDGWTLRAPELFGQLNSLFSNLMGTGGLPVVPQELAQDLASKRIGLIGFNEQESIRVRATFNHVSAVVRDLGALSTGLGLEALQTHDLIVLNACTEEGVRSWDSILAQPVLQQNILVIASRSALLDPKLGLLDRAVDFVLEPWDSEELLCRAQKVICHKSALPQRQAEQRTKPAVLIADDDPLIHSLLTPMLNKLGIDCYAAKNGGETVELVSKLSPDLLILDVVMPVMNGLAVLREIRKTQQNSSIRILMLSARQQRSDISMALAFGANDYAVKPFDPEDIVLRVTRLLPQRSGAGVDKNQTVLLRDPA